MIVALTLIVHCNVALLENEDDEYDDEDEEGGGRENVGDNGDMEDNDDEGDVGGGVLNRLQFDPHVLRAIYGRCCSIPNAHF